jgi:thiamine monophosphate kinase
VPDFGIHRRASEAKLDRSPYGVPETRRIRFAITSEDIGYKALEVNLRSRAMAAQPASATLLRTLPRADEGWIADFARGIFDLAEAHGVALVGGDLTRGPTHHHGGASMASPP